MVHEEALTKACVTDAKAVQNDLSTACAESRTTRLCAVVGLSATPLVPTSRSY